MDENEINANYLDIDTDISKLLENFEKLQKPINDVVPKFFGTAHVAGTILAQIKALLDKHAHSVDVANDLFRVPVTSTRTLKEIGMFILKQYILNNVENNFFWGRPASETTSLTGPSLAEIKSAIDEQKLTSELFNRFFEGSKPQEITTTFFNIDRHIKGQELIGMKELIITFFF